MVRRPPKECGSVFCHDSPRRGGITHARARTRSHARPLHAHAHTHPHARAHAHGHAHAWARARPCTHARTHTRTRACTHARTRYAPARPCTRAYAMHARARELPAHPHPPMHARTRGRSAGMQYRPGRTIRGVQWRIHPTFGGLSANSGGGRIACGCRNPLWHNTLRENVGTPRGPPGGIATSNLPA